MSDWFGEYREEAWRFAMRSMEELAIGMSESELRACLARYEDEIMGLRIRIRELEEEVRSRNSELEEELTKVV